MLKPIDDDFRDIIGFVPKVTAAQEQSTFRYVVADAVQYKIFGTNDVRDLLTPKYFKGHSIFDRVKGIEMKPKDLALRYIGTLSPEKKSALFLEMMVHYLTQK